MLLRRKPLCSSPRLRRKCLPKADGLGHLRHVLAADQPGTHARQFALMPLRMQHEKRLGHHKPKHGVAEKFQAFIVAYGRLIAVCLSELVGQ